MTSSFGFIVHPLTGLQQRIFGIRSLNGALSVGRRHSDFPPKIIARNTLELGQGVLEGTLVSLSSLPEDLLADQVRTVNHLEAAARLCVTQGCQVIGLGGVAAMVGGQGKALAQRASVPVTSGNHLTAFTAFMTALNVLSLMPPELWRVSIIGLPSPVGSLLISLLARAGVEVEIVSNGLPKPTERFLQNLRAGWGLRSTIVPTVEDISCPLLIAASSTGAGIHLSRIRSHTVVVDVAAPADIIIDSNPSSVMVIDGEYLSPPTALKGDLWQSVYGYLTHQPKVLFACFVEPMLIALSGRTDLCGVGRQLDVAKAYTLGQIAAENGFIVDGFYRHGKQVSADKLLRCLKLAK